MIQLRWSLNEKYEKTPRRKPEQHIPSEQTQTMEEEIVTRSEFLKLQDNDESDNKRESTYSKMGERDLISQSNMNPFMSKNNYVNDLDVQDQFLKPQNSNFVNKQ